MSGGITRARIKFNRRGRATLREKRAIRRIPAFTGRGSRRVHASSRSRRRARTFTLDQSLREALQVVARSTRRLDGQDPLRLERDAQVRRGRELRLRFPPIRTAGRPGGGRVGHVRADGLHLRGRDRREERREGDARVEGGRRREEWASAGERVGTFWKCILSNAEYKYTMVTSSWRTTRVREMLHAAR